MWEISFGSILALSEFSNKNFKLSNIISATGIAITFYCFFSPKIISNHGINNFLAILGATLIIISGIKNTLLNNRLMIFLGLISYPLYLWHWQIIIFISIVDGGEPSNRIKIFIIFISLLLAWLSYRYKELPFKKNNKCTLIVGITCTILIMVFSFYIHNGIKFTIRNSDYENYLIEYKYQEKF